MYTTEDDRRDITADEYYEDAVREAFEILGEHKETISTVKKLLDQLSGDEKEHFQQLRKSLHSSEKLIDDNIDVLKEKFGSELSPGKCVTTCVCVRSCIHVLVRIYFAEDIVVNPIEKSTVEALLNFWKELKHAFETRTSNKKLPGQVELEDWLQKVDRKTRTQYDVIGSLMMKIKSMPHHPHNEKEQ